MEQGLTIIYWGDGKGKTTAAVGLALRALGQGQRVLFTQFMKGEDWKTGEAKMFEWLEQLPSPQPSPSGRGGSDKIPLPWGEGDRRSGEGAMFEFHIFGKGWVGIKGDQKPITEHQSAARAGLDFVKREIAIGRDDNTECPAGHSVLRAQWDLVILDEILSAVDAGLVTVNEIKELIRAKPPPVHLLMTGHQQYPELAELADVVTNMEKIKHPFDQGVQAQKGVDF